MRDLRETKKSPADFTDQRRFNNTILKNMNKISTTDVFL